MPLRPVESHNCIIQIVYNQTWFPGSAAAARALPSNLIEGYTLEPY